MHKARWARLALPFAVAVSGCGGNGEPSDDADGGAPVEDMGIDAESSPAEAFNRFCAGRVWENTLTDATVGKLSGDYLGYYGFPTGSLESMKLIPEHPFRVRAIRASYLNVEGPVRIHLTGSWGRSYPDLENMLMPTLDAEVTEDDLGGWVEFDVSEHDVLLLPTQHYAVVNEVLGQGAQLALEDLPAGERSRALIQVPGEAMPYGSEGNFRMELVGEYFCTWEEQEHWFSESLEQPFAEVPSGRAAFTDLDGDGHDDLVLNDGSPHAFLGDGKGQFSAPGFDPFPDTEHVNMLVFADVDNDGDVDAFANTYMGVDDDSDGVYKDDGDCNDREAAVHPGAPEVPGNGRDDDCDGMADSGTDTSDADGDLVSILAGDCDDTRDDVAPGLDELLDGVDNDCDQQVDEDFVDRILLNDGAGHFAVLPGSGLEARDPSTAAGFGDADGDGNLDLYWGNWLIRYPEDPAVQDRFFRGLGDGTFEDAQAAAGLVLPTPFSVYGLKWNDYNNDGWQDIFVGNYHLYANQLWENQGDGTFIDVAEAVGAAFDDIPGPYPWLPGGHTYGGDWGDIDNDGDMDYFMANLAHPRVMPWSDPSMFLINSGPPGFTFENRREELGIVYDEGDLNGEFADYDNDMDLDLVVGPTYPNHYSKLYRNDGEQGFTDVTYETRTAVHSPGSVVWSDVDEDGDLDLVIAGGSPARAHLFINRVGQDRNSVQLLLEGTTTNRGAVGARVTLTAGGVTQMRDVVGGGGHYNTQCTAVVHFGLGDETDIDSLTVRWVGGATESISGAAANGRFRIVEGSGQAVPE